MPVEVQGIVELRKALRKFQPDLEKNLKKEVTAVLRPIVSEARSYVDNNPKGLSNWTAKGQSKQITKKTSMFRLGTFPVFNAANVKRGITYSLKPTKKNSKGFVAVFQLRNTTAAGAIYETAGRKNPEGQPWVGAGSKAKKGHGYSHSFNPNAGAHFIEALGGESNLFGKNKKRGRLIYRAWEQNNGRALNYILKAIDTTVKQFKGREATIKAFGGRKAA